MAKKDNRQIIKINGKNVFVEAMRNCFYSVDEHGNVMKDVVLLNFQQYDDTKAAGSKTVAQVPIFISFDKWHMITGMIQSGAFERIRDSIPEIKKYHDVVKENESIKNTNATIAVMNTFIKYQNDAMKGMENYVPMKEISPLKAKTLPSGYVNNKCITLEGGSTKTGEARRFTIGPAGTLPCVDAKTGKYNYVLVAQKGPGTVNPTTGGITMSGKPTDSVQVRISEEDLVRVFTTVEAEIQAHLAKRHSLHDVNLNINDAI